MDIRLLDKGVALARRVIRAPHMRSLAEPFKEICDIQKPEITTSSEEICPSFG